MSSHSPNYVTISHLLKCIQFALSPWLLLSVSFPSLSWGRCSAAGHTFACLTKLPSPASHSSFLPYSLGELEWVSLLLFLFFLLFTVRRIKPRTRTPGKCSSSRMSSLKQKLGIISRIKLWSVFQEEIKIPYLGEVKRVFFFSFFKLP